MGNQFSVLFNDHLMGIGLAVDFNSIEIKASTKLAGINGKLMCTAGNKTISIVITVSPVTSVTSTITFAVLSR